MNILITGANGLLGKFLYKKYKELGHTVVGVDNFINSEKGDDKIIDLDCGDYDNLSEIVKYNKIDIIFHLACLPYEGFSNISPYQITKSVFEPTVAIGSIASNFNVKRVYNFSSMARYGNGNRPFYETDCCNPVDPYGISKVAGERILNQLSELYDFEVVHLIPHNVFGTNVRWDDIRRGVINIFIMQALLGQPLTIHNTGEQIRSFSFVEDALSFYEQLLYCSVESKECFNIGPDSPETCLSINQLAEMILKETQSKSSIQYVAKVNDVCYASCSSDKIRNKFNWKSKVCVKDEIKKMVFYAKNNIDLKNFKWRNTISVEIKNKCPDYWL